MTRIYSKDGIDLHCGDNCDVLGTMPKESVDLVVTSPPYDDLRTYSSSNFVVFRDNISHEQQQLIIAELAALGINPVPSP